MIILIFLLFVIATGSCQTDSSEEVTAGKRHFLRSPVANMCHENLVFSSPEAVVRRCSSK